MQLFLSDLWADLREKRLWPVAVALLLGLIAVPLVLAKPASDPVPAAVPAQTSQLPDAGLKVLAAQDDTGAGSDLGVFNPKDPFRLPSKVLHSSSSSTTSTASSATSGSAGPTSSGSSGGVAPSPSGSSGGGSGTLGGNSGGGSGGGNFTPSKPITRTQRYEYVIDVTFNHNTRTRRVKSMHRLDMLPSQAAPLLIFMGVDKNASNAVFLVDSTLTGVGEGTCRPSPDKCSFLYLGSGSVHAFTGQDGQSYTLRIDEIRRMKVPSSHKKSSSKSSKSSKGKAPKKSARARGAQAEPRAFVPPVLIDLVDVTTTTHPGHSSKSKRDR
jgi:hypothetical protein